MDTATADKHPQIDRAIKLKGSQAALAAAVGCAQQHISKLLKFQVPITAELALSIEKATAGQVTRADLRPDLDWSPPTVPDADSSAPVSRDE